jgi:hypothetical protein
MFPVFIPCTVETSPRGLGLDLSQHSTLKAVHRNELPDCPFKFESHGQITKLSRNRFYVGTAEVRLSSEPYEYCD